MLKKSLFILFCIFSISNSVSFADKTTTPTTDEWSLEQSDGELAIPGAEPTAPPEFQGTFLKMLFMLVGIIALLVLTFILFRRFMNTRMMSGNQNNVIKVIEKRAISPKSMLYLVEVGDDTVLVAESHLEVRALHYLEKK